MLHHRRRGEEGQVAVLVGLLSVVLMGAASMAVDLGQAFLQRQDVQKDTDLAALAGVAGSNLPGTTPGTCGYGPRAAATDQAVEDVAAHLVANAGDTWAVTPTPTGLVDCNLTNGEVFYGSVSTASGALRLAYDPYLLTVLSPERDVSFAFAPVLGTDSTQVDARATAAIRSPAVRSVPFYAFVGCDWGRQTIAQPNNGHADLTVDLAFPDETNGATLGSLTTDPVSDPPRITVPAPDPSPLAISGTGLKNAQKPVMGLGFFEPGGSAPVWVPAADFAAHTDTTIRLANVPAGVSTVPGDWYVRVRTSDGWSKVYDNRGTLLALPLIVGNPTLTCGQGSSDGNFGTLRLFPSWGGGSTNVQIALNIAKGLEHTLAVHPSPGATGLCSTSTPGTVLWPNEATNCIATDPGMAAQAAQAGFIEGVGSTKGRLGNVQAGTGCAESGVPATTVLEGFVINNDTLSCFLTDDGVNLGTVNSADYAGDPVFSPAIYHSPRFMLIPVLAVQPTSGASRTYQIVGFRPAFLTGQPNSATRTTAANAGNGLTLDRHGEIESVQVVFINGNALPPMDAAGTTDYAGSGPRVIRLVD